MDISHALHLSKRFFDSLLPGGPDQVARAWVSETLSAQELGLWMQLSGPDQRHSIEVAKRVQLDLDSRAIKPVLAAALLHDIGKIESRLGTFARVLATLIGLVLGKHRMRNWVDRPGQLGRLGKYHAHPELGAEMLRNAGSDFLTVTWALEHHLSAKNWTLDLVVANALKNADDD